MFSVNKLIIKVIIIICTKPFKYFFISILSIVPISEIYIQTLNYILGKIEEASQNRVAEGKDPIKVVFVDLYYSDRTYNYKELNNRDTTPNQIGLKLTDYQRELDDQLSKWNESEYLSCYNFNTRDYEIVNQQTCPYVSTDNLHFSKFTYGQYGNAFAQFLLDEVFYA